MEIGEGHGQERAGDRWRRSPEPHTSPGAPDPRLVDSFIYADGHKYLNYNIIFKPEASSVDSAGLGVKDLWLPQIYASHLMHFNLLSCQSAGAEQAHIHILIRIRIRVRIRTRIRLSIRHPSAQVCLSTCGWDLGSEELCDFSWTRTESKLTALPGGEGGGGGATS